ncbi:hypothetical protein C8R44DRAFT_372560 [Mycena epipterygia]|nr:hypothetical protein C8R44DRAFT_372560 [Mycena epipterygia]
MSQSNALEITLSKIRDICCKLHFHPHLHGLWSIIKRLVRLRWLVWRTAPRAFARPNSTIPTTAQTGDVFSLDPPHPEPEPYGSSLPSCSIPANTPEITVDCGEPSISPSSPCTSQTLDGGSTFDMQTDILQPMQIPPQLVPIRPDELLRYSAKVPIPTDRATYTVSPLQTDFRSESREHLPPGWQRFRHIDGTEIFYQSEKRIMTETWLYDPKFSREITRFIEMIDDFIVANQIRIPRNSQRVVELRADPESQEYTCGYYFAQQETRCIFWLQDVCLDECLYGVRGGELAAEHIQIQLEYQYWKHLELFEIVQEVSIDDLRELEEIIISSLIDTMTCPVSTVNHSEKELSKMMNMVQHTIQARNAGGRGYPSFVGKAMSQFIHERFINYHGQEAARLSRYQSVHGEPSWQDKKRSWLMSILSPILFYAPDVHLCNLGKVWVDRIVAKQPWVKLISKLTSEWAEHTAFATILLNANVAFLDIPGVDSGGPSQSLTQIFSYISIVLVIGSTILGLMLVRHHRSKHIGTALEGADF